MLEKLKKALSGVVCTIYIEFKKALFPTVCPICGKLINPGQKICDKCRKEIIIINEPKCIKCGKPLRDDGTLYCSDCRKVKHFFEKGVAVFEYSGVFRESIYRFKYDNAREYADFYGSVAAKIYGKTFKDWNIQAIIPVPMYYKKENKRGYNQACVFAKAVSAYTGIVLEEKILIRRKDTIPQKELSDELRIENLSKAFAVNLDKVAGYKSILLVDDIYTTGSTIDACAKILITAGVEKVYFLCISTKRS